ncbi:MAG: FGGY-family carbohydrate kinase [Verrucomicrobia bacterium]|nr:FGGY-family carbohydrate kinase [Verrucomicrobiota bacterium]
MGLLLGIDLGTSYFKVALFTPEGTMRGLGRVRVETTSPAPGRVELEAATFWLLLRRGLAEALAQAGASPSEISGVAYSSQATTFLLLDARDQPLTPLVLWTDTRGAPIEDAVDGVARRPEFAAAVGHRGLVAESAVPKLRWFQRVAPDLWKRTARVMTVSDYFTFALTGERAGDASTAAFLGLYHLGERRWWPEAMAAFGLDPARFSTPLRPGSPCGRTRGAADELLGLPAGVPCAVGAIDHHAAAIGSGLGRLAEISISTGTVLAALAIVDRVEPADGCYHGPHVDGVRFYRLAFDPNGAGQLEVYQRREAPGLSIEQLLELAARAPAGGGIPGDHGGAVRGLLERVAVSHRELVRRVTGGQAPARVIATGGGARSPLWLQIDADILNATIVRPASPERACLGAAAFAAVAAGYYSSVDGATAAMVRPDREFAPAGRGGRA